MGALFIVFAIILASVGALLLAYFGYVMLARFLGKETLERYIRMRVQGPFVPVPGRHGDGKKNRQQ